jgi:16S rRNA processing protein RimM
MSTIVVAKMLTSHGIAGNVKLESYTENPKDVFNYELFDVNNKKYNIKFIGTLKPNVFIVNIEGITTPEQAKEYRNTELFTILTDDEVYFDELIGMEVRTTDSLSKGKIVSINNYGAGDIIEIRWDGERNPESLPFIDEYFKEVTKEYVVVERPQYV